MYLQGFIVPVPSDKRNDYCDVAERFWHIAHDHGAIEHVEAWEADIPDGKQTDFRKAVALEDGEKVVFAWVTWPDKDTADGAHARMMDDPRMKDFGETMPFDGKRMIFGGFEPIVETGEAGGSYVDGFVAPVANDRREDYRKAAETAAAIFIEHGALRDVECWGIDTPVGERTSFPRSVLAKDGESVVFSFVEWPDEAARTAGWEKLMADERMTGMDMPFDGKRMFWGGFRPVVAKGRD